MVALHDMVGLTGISLSVFCYARVQWNPGYAKRLSYSALNFLSALLLGDSLVHNWNLSSFAANGFWGLISLYGLVRALRPGSVMPRSHGGITTSHRRLEIFRKHVSM